MKTFVRDHPMRPKKIDCWFPLTWESFQEPAGRQAIFLLLSFNATKYHTKIYVLFLKKTINRCMNMSVVIVPPSIFRI
jgi:hypothetical protein